MGILQDGNALMLGVQVAKPLLITALPMGRQVRRDI